MGSGTRTMYPCRLNNGLNLKFSECYPDQQTSWKHPKTQQPKQYDKNKDGDDSLNVNNVKNLNLGDCDSQQDAAWETAIACYWHLWLKSLR